MILGKIFLEKINVRFVTNRCGVQNKNNYFHQKRKQ